jgi:hypothetical protein
MSSRTRVISQNKSVYVSNTGWYTAASANMIEPHQLHRVDTFSFDIDLAGAREDIREFGQLARIGTLTMREINPTVSLGYYLGNGENELAIGLQSSTGLDTQMISGILTEHGPSREKNIYTLIVKEGEDAFNTGIYQAQSANHDVIGFGNCVLTSYGANFAVGEIPRVDLEWEASNIVFYTGGHSGFKNPAINKQGARADSGIFNLPAPDTGDMNVLVLRPDDITVSFLDDKISSGELGGTDFSDMCIQSCAIDIPLTRGNIECLGEERAVAKPLEFPIDVTVSINAIVKNFKSGALEYVLTGTAGNNNTTIAVNIKNDALVDIHNFRLKNAVLDSQAFSQGLDDNETVDLTFSAQIGGASTETDGLFWSGNATYAADVPTSGDAVAAQPI